MTLRWVPGWNGLTEPEAVSYVAAVEAADGQELEFGVARAINDFVLGCKNDGIWSAIKACNILAGARTLNGALVPLAGTAAPTKQGTEAGWNYNRKTGLQGNGTDNYLNSNRAANLQSSASSLHLSVYASSTQTNTANTLIGAYDNGSAFRSALVVSGVLFGQLNLDNASTSSGITPTTGLVAASRLVSTPTTTAFRVSGNSSLVTNQPVGTAPATNHFVFARNLSGASQFSTSRLAFYSIGESLDLEKLDNRVTRLMNLITYTQTAGLPDLATMDLDAAAYIGGGYRVGGTLS